MPRSLISITEARRRVLDATTSAGHRAVELDDALGRVLARDVTAAGDVPPFPCSAMDGYAVIAGDAGRTLRIVGESRAGTPSSHRLAEGEAIRISTGAAVPPGATSVIPQEDVDLNGGDAIHTNAAAEPGEHIRGAGEDMRAQTIVLSAGTPLGPVALGAAAAAGVGSVIATRRPRVSVLCTGDELRAPGEPLGPGEIHNSNAPMLTGLARRAGAVTIPARRLPDDRDATTDGIARGDGGLRRRDHLRRRVGRTPRPRQTGPRRARRAGGVLERRPSARQADLVRGPGGGSSAGVRPPRQPGVRGRDFQPVRGARPGRPPGRPAVPSRPAPTAILGTDVARNPRRDQMIRVRLTDEGDAVRAYPNGAQGSHILTSLLGADALALIPSGEGELPGGTTVTPARPGRLTPEAL